MIKLLCLLVLFKKLVTFKNQKTRKKVKWVKSAAVQDEAAGIARLAFGEEGTKAKRRHDDSTVGALVCLCVGAVGCMASFTAA